MDEKERQLEEVAYEELKADGFDPFCRGHMPPDLARMIVGELCKDSLLKEEIRLLQSPLGQSYMFMRLFKDDVAKAAIQKGGGGIFRRI